MFQTFTGSARRPRQVNLSGRNSNPFAAVQQKSAPQASAVQQAQQDRKVRQQERDRLQAAKTIQRIWRGYGARKGVRAQLRLAWDLEDQAGHFEPFLHLKLLLRFASPRRIPDDSKRVGKYVVFFNEWLSAQRTSTTLDRLWAIPLMQLSRVVLTLLDPHNQSVQVKEASNELLEFLQRMTLLFPDNISALSYGFYTTLAKVATADMTLKRRQSIQILAGLLLERTSNGRREAHKGLITGLLVHPWLHDRIDMDALGQSVDAKELTLALQETLTPIGEVYPRDCAWVLAHYIYLYRNSSRRSRPSDDAVILAHVNVLTSLMSEISTIQREINNTTPSTTLPQFVQQVLETLIDQETIASLLTHIEFRSSDERNSDYAAVLASYVLTLIQVFPRRNDEIRMWLFRGSASIRTDAEIQHLPAIKFFWQSVARTRVFRQICDGPRDAVELLSPKSRYHMTGKQRLELDQEWRTILLFFELYTFALKIMDDDEFMSNGYIPEGYASWTRRSALELSQVRVFTIFLKNLAFAMYWYSVDINGVDQLEETYTLKSYFSASTDAMTTSVIEKPSSSDPLVVSGVQSSSISYMKGTVTGLLRMLYERDSRRQFLPPDHWLMKQFDMTGFIGAVLEEQRHKDEHHNDEERENLSDEDDFDIYDRDLAGLIGSQRTQNVRRIEQIRRQQQRAARKRRMEETVPRLNVLENMPFFIPFATRVQIFREFVRADQEIRRNGYIDPDQWRMSIIHRGGGSSPASREDFLRQRSAKVRREHVFEDAFDQFYELGESLKEPIQITFVDQFDTPEAGIDGGGVTKEFLTSVTNEAFKNGDLKLFVENDQHLLYPNPVSFDKRRAFLQETGLAEGSPDWDSQMRLLRKEYEFLGRIVGKCLYEGILIDIHFAPFFLVKWALTGGYGLTANESTYRPTINDLRDLDVSLYDGLLKLKTYAGNVEDFGLDFTIVDTISDAEEGTRSHQTITRELRPNGANTPVTNANRPLYITSVARHRLQVQQRQQTNAFLRGLGTMIQPSWLSMFNQLELQTLVGGDSSEIDVQDLRRNTLYGGVYVIGDDGLEHPTVQYFWEVMEELSDEDRRKVLKYVTSTPRAPLLGFGQLRPPFSIRDSGSDEARLPSTSTCVNLLKLPIYTSKAAIRDKLVYAINAGAGFNLS